MALYDESLRLPFSGSKDPCPDYRSAPILLFTLCVREPFLASDWSCESRGGIPLAESCTLEVNGGANNELRVVGERGGGCGQELRQPAVEPPPSAATSWGSGTTHPDLRLFTQLYGKPTMEIEKEVKKVSSAREGPLEFLRRGEKVTGSEEPPQKGVDL